MIWTQFYWSNQFTSDFGIAQYLRHPCMNEIKGDSVIAARIIKPRTIGIPDAYALSHT